MRLRLCIQRNELPSVNTLWPVSAIQHRFTVAQLLEEVNKIFPLEGDTWGLENYTVALADYECLHYHEIGSVFKDDDEVIIRPLQYAEIRARTLLGRDRITPDGRHLLDGLPFGRPLLKAAQRPDLRIPARKRRKLDNDIALLAPDNQLTDQQFEQFVEHLLDPEEDEQDVGCTIGPGRPSNGTVTSSDKDESDEDDDGDFQPDDDASDEEEEIEDSDAEDDEAVTTPSHLRKRKRRAVTFVQDTDSDDSSSASGSTSDSEAYSSSEASQEQSENGTLQNAESKALVVQKLQSAQLRTRPQVPSITLSNSKQSRLDKQDAMTFVGTPGAGMTKTKLRNARRRDSKKLKYLKKTGQIEANARLADIRQPRETKQNNTRTDKQNDANASSQVKKPEAAEMERKRKQLLEAILNGGIDVSDSIDDRAVTSPRKRHISSSTTHSSADEAPEELPSKLVQQREVIQVGKAAAADETLIVSDVDSKNPLGMVPSSVTRRTRLDVAGAQRMLFGSLGSRVPKTQLDKNTVQSKLANRRGQNDQVDAVTIGKNLTDSVAKQSEAIDAEENEENEDPDSWLTKISLSAVECCERGIILSTPPFPFYQRWDPQQRLKRKKRLTRQSFVPEDVNGFEEQYDKYNQDGTGDALEYDDAVDEAADDEYWEEGALLDDTNADAGSDEDADDFPLLPNNIEDLPLINENAVKVGNVIVFSELTCSAATRWQPGEVTRTIRLEAKDASTGEWTVLHANRDMPHHEYDEEGNRVYSKFEMQGADEEDATLGGTERRRAISWAALTRPRLLAAA